MSDLKIGWRAIGLATGRNPCTLQNANSLGLLPVVPIRVGAQVAMTPAQIETVKAMTRPPRPRNDKAEV